MACCREITLTVNEAGCLIANDGGSCLVQNVPYTNQYSASGGTPPYVFSISAGALPTGVSMDASGAVTGTPTALGDFSFTVKVVDANAQECTLDQSVHVGAICGLDPRTFDPEPVDPFKMIWTLGGGGNDPGAIVWANGSHADFSLNSPVDCLFDGKFQEMESYMCNTCDAWVVMLDVFVSGTLQPSGDCPGPNHYDPSFNISMQVNGVFVLNEKWSTVMPADFLLPGGGNFSNSFQVAVPIGVFPGGKHFYMSVGMTGGNGMGVTASGTIDWTPRYHP